jgi:hypothetical protein
LRRIRRHLSFANVVSVVALFVALGGGAYAAFHLPRNSVKSRHIKNGQVKRRDLAKPQSIRSAGLAVGEDCTPTPNEWVSIRTNLFGRVGYYRDLIGRVHLSGDAGRCGNPPSEDTIFTLPRGYRPATEQSQLGFQNGDTLVRLSVTKGGSVTLPGSAEGDQVFLGDVSFRCGPSGHNGCP